MSESLKKKIKIPIAIYTPKNATPLSIMNFLQEYILKEDNLEIAFIEENQKNALEKITQTGVGIILFEIPDKNHVMPIVNLLTALQDLVKKRNVKAFGFCQIKNPKLTTLLMKRGVTELLDSNIQERSIKYKFDKILQIIESQLILVQKKEALLKESTLNQNSQPQNGEYSQPKTEWCISENFNSDFWIIQKKQDVKRILGKWFLELFGPPPAFGKWEGLENNSQKNSIWRFIPRSSREPFYQNKGEWRFFGKMPEFSWQTHKWQFTGEQCRLEFYTNKDLICKRAGLDGETYRITQNPDNAESTLNEIRNLLIQELKFELTKKTPNTPAYYETVERLKKAQNFNFLISNETQKGGVLGVFELEEAPQSADYIDKKSASEQSKWNNKVQPDISNEKSEWDELFNKINVEINFVIPEQAITTEAQLLDLDEENLSLMAMVPEDIINKNALIDINITQGKEHINFSLEAKVEELLLLDEDGNYSIDLKLKKIDPVQFEKLRLLILSRQTLSTNFFNSAKGVA